MDRRIIHYLWRKFLVHYDSYSIAEELEKKKPGITDKLETQAAKEAAMAILSRICEILGIPDNQKKIIWKGDERPFTYHLQDYKEEAQK